MLASQILSHTVIIGALKPCSWQSLFLAWRIEVVASDLIPHTRESAWVDTAAQSLTTRIGDNAHSGAVIMHIQLKKAPTHRKRMVRGNTYMIASIHDF